jgi:hypothetical protein
MREPASNDCAMRALYFAQAPFDRTIVAIEYASLHVFDPNR